MAGIQTNLACWLLSLFSYPFLHLSPLPPSRIHIVPLIKELLAYLTAFHSTCCNAFGAEKLVALIRLSTLGTQGLNPPAFFIIIKT